MTGIFINISHIPPEPISPRLESKSDLKIQLPLLKCSVNNQRKNKINIPETEKDIGFLSNLWLDQCFP